MRPCNDYRLKWEISNIELLEMEKNTSLDWRMQTIEDDLSKLQVKLQGGTQSSGQRQICCTIVSESTRIE